MCARVCVGGINNYFSINRHLTFHRGVKMIMMIIIIKYDLGSFFLKKKKVITFTHPCTKHPVIPTLYKEKWFLQDGIIFFLLIFKI